MRPPWCPRGEVRQLRRAFEDERSRRLRAELRLRRMEAIAEDYERHPDTMGNVGSFAAEIRAALR